jgi:hypothetical protein
MSPAEIMRSMPGIEVLPSDVLELILSMYYKMAHAELLRKCLIPQPFPYKGTTAYPVILCRKEIGAGTSLIDDGHRSVIARRKVLMSERQMIKDFRWLYFNSPKKWGKKEIAQGHIYISHEMSPEEAEAELAVRGYVRP